MQRSGAATRRSYAAFYQWSVRSANPSKPCAGNGLVSRRKQSTAHAAHRKIGVRLYSSLPTTGNAEVSLETRETLRAEEVQSPVDRPFESLLAWDHVVRAKSKKTVTLEIAVPAWVLRNKVIRQEAEKLDVKFRTPTYQEGLEDDKLEPIRLRGAYTDVCTIWRDLYMIGHPSQQDGPEANTAQSANETDVEQSPALAGHDQSIEKFISLPDAFVKPIGRRGTIEYFKTRFGLQAEQMDKYGTYNFLQLKGDAKQLQEVSQLLEEIRTYLSQTQRPSVGTSQLAQQTQIIRHNDLHLEDLRYWQFVRRAQLSGRAEEEFCLPESTWQRMKQDGDVEDLRLLYGVIPKELKLFSDGKKRGISLNGNVADVDRAKVWLAEFNISIPQMQTDTEYLRIHVAATGMRTSEEGVPTDGGRLIVEELRDKLAEDPWRTKRILATTPHKETAGDPAERAQLSDEESKTLAKGVNTTPTVANGTPVKAHSTAERPVANAAVSQSFPQKKVKLADDMRTALRHISQPVALVTSLQKGAIQRADRDITHFRGVTVSSFCTVTLAPVPVISFNLRVPSRSWDAISSSGELRVHLLKASPEGAAAAHAFTQRYIEPHEPFEHLSRHPSARIHKGSTPLLSWRAAVQTDISARIMRDKCVQVGDHMIVVAEVRKVRLPGNDDFGSAGGLAYGMQSYRQLGGEIKPMQIEAPASEQAREEVQPAASVISTEKNVPAHPNEKAAPRTIEDLGPSSPILDQDSLQQVLEATDKSYDTESLPAQAAAANRMLAETLKAVKEAYRGSSDASATPQAASDQAFKTTTTTLRPAGAPSPGKAWGFADKNTIQNRTMSTWAYSTHRSYSSNSSGSASSPIPEKILKTTVGDYLAQPPAHRKRYTDMIRSVRKSERIEAALERGDDYTPEEAAELAEEVQVARRKVARDLAVRNAEDLCAMLDEGRVVMSRVPFLESNLEQGQAALLTEAKIKRDLLERGNIGGTEFEQAKVSLTKDYEFIDAQLMRLRDIVEEDDIDDDEDR